ncbi:MAG: ABC transporter substrate-binding protein [Proteobacteria bacterium]|nr:ABC transporter substrate-binding protein [Pseudomonadota bacterium]MBS0495908.1 ABC transporter substrate-binding protein [Pseudomonadota bacterium]
MKPTPIKRILIVLAILLGLLLLMTSLAQAQGVQVTDDRGRAVMLREPPRRIVTLLPSLAETVCALGACERLVGVDRYTNWPSSVKQLPQVGGGIDPNIEAIVALRPDVVLLTTSSRAADRLQALGIPVVALEPKTHADMQRVLAKVAQLLAVGDAQALWRSIDLAVTAAAQSLPESARGQRVYFEVNPGPYGAGAASFIGETLTRLGARNILPASLGPFPKLNPEYIVRADPDLIMVGSRSADALQARPGWAAMRALRQGHLCRFSPAEADILVRPGPRMAEAARLMADCLIAGHR